MTCPICDGDIELRTCHVCNAECDTRPYGPNGEEICIDCLAGASPLLEQQTALAFALQVIACGDYAIMGGRGPTPLPDDRHRWN